MDTQMDARKAATSQAAFSLSSMLLPLALAQFICSYAGSSMNVAVSNMAHDLGTTVYGIQAVITLFTLTMAVLMIPGSKLTDIWGRKTCFVIGLALYGLGALISAVAPTVGVMLFGNSLLEGVGSALMIPPIYILVTVSFADLTTRAKSFGVISGAAGLGAATGPLIGGLITTAISWRASFLLQVLVIGAIIILSRRIPDAGIHGATPHFDVTGAVLSGAGLFFVVLGILETGTYGWVTAREDFSIGPIVLIHEGGIAPVWVFVALGALLLVGFFLHIRSEERAGTEPLLSTRLFRNRAANLGLVTQNIQWLILQGSTFVIAVFLQTARHYSAIQTGLALTPAIIGMLVTSSAAGKLARKYSQKTLIVAGFVTTIAGLSLLLLLANAPSTSNILNAVPGLLLMGAGVGIMLTSSVNVVQSSFPDQDQGAISGLSRSISNLGSSLGTALVGSILVSPLLSENQGYGAALFTVVAIAAIGLVAALLIPREQTTPHAAGLAHSP
jgi:MFS family permease